MRTVDIRATLLRVTPGRKEVTVRITLRVSFKKQSAHFSLRVHAENLKVCALELRLPLARRRGAGGRRLNRFLGPGPRARARAGDGRELEVY